ncbi:MAG: class I SAM-dependent methyltransferase [Gemmataceae bacterium]
MSATARIASERNFHDAQARARALTFAHEPHRLQFSDDEYLNHEPWVRPAMARLGDVRGKRVLDLGCGHGMAAVVLARRGARVTACDLSPGYVTEAQQRAAANGVSIRFNTADAEHLPYADHSFNAVWGHAILHHLDVPTAARELRRVLKPSGVAVFCEPWAGNPLLRAARRWLTHTPDEQPLSRAQVAQLREVFGEVSVQGWQLVSMLRRVVPLPRALARLDARILRSIPLLSNWCRYAVLVIR